MVVGKGLIEAGDAFKEEGHAKSSAEFKRKMEGRYKDYVAQLKKMSRAEEHWELKNKQILKRFSEEFKKSFEDNKKNLREFAEYQSRMMKELSVAHSKVDFFRWVYL